jgi:hypothetical protein
MSFPDDYDSRSPISFVSSCLVPEQEDASSSGCTGCSCGICAIASGTGIGDGCGEVFSTGSTFCVFYAVAVKAPGETCSTSARSAATGVVASATGSSTATACSIATGYRFAAFIPLA